MSSKDNSRFPFQRTDEQAQTDVGGAGLEYEQQPQVFFIEATDRLSKIGDFQEEIDSSVQKSNRPLGSPAFQIGPIITI